MTSRLSFPIARLFFLIAIISAVMASGCTRRTVETIGGPGGDISPAPAKVAPANFGIFIDADPKGVAVLVALPVNSDVYCEIRNVTGYHVRTLFSGSAEAGYEKYIWDGTNDDGKRVGSGFYNAYATGGFWNRSVQFMIEWKN